MPNKQRKTNYMEKEQYDISVTPDHILTSDINLVSCILYKICVN